MQVLTFPGRRDGGTGSAKTEEHNVLSTLHTPAVAAFYDEMAGAGGAIDPVREGGTTALQRRIKGIDLALLQCQECVAIPAVVLAPHRELVNVVDKVSGGRLDLEALGLASRIHDDTFLNESRSIVNGWVKEVQRVARLTETPFPDTATKNFRLRSVLGQPGIQVIVGLLKQANRYLATVALDTNTGLKDARETAEDVNGFLKGFPLMPCCQLPIFLLLLKHYGASVYIAGL